MGRIPFLRLLRYPTLFLAVFGAAAILAAVTAAGSPFLSATTGATLHRLIERDAEFRIPTLTITADSSVSSDVIAYRTELLERELGPLLGAPIVTARGDTVVALAGRPKKPRDQPVRIITRTGFLDHVERLQGTGPGGIWIADVTARELKVEPGDTIRIATAFTSARVTVAGVYQDLLREPRRSYWASLGQFLYGSFDQNTRPPPFMLMDLATYVSLEERLLDDQDELSWAFRLPTRPMSIDAAEELAARLDRFQGVISNTSRDVGAAFRRSNRDEPFSGWLSSAKEISDPIAAPVSTLALAGRGVALAMLAGSGVFMMRRRRVEVAVLDARGVGPIRLGARTIAEVALPVVLGAVAGSALALWAVDRLGPGGPMSEASVRDAFVAVAWTCLVAIVLLGVVAARSLSGERTPGVSVAARVTSRVPWDLLLLVLAGVTFAWLRSGREGGAQSPSELDPLFLLFPLLLLTGAAGLAARGLRLLLPQLRRWGDRWRPAAYLATRRLAGAPQSATWLLVASAVAVGILVYAGTLTTSLGESATQGAALSAGSDVAVEYTGTLEGGEEAPFPVTSVVRVDRVSFAAGSEAELDLLLVDPDTFEEAAFWRGEFSGDPLEALMDALGRDGDRVPAIVAGSLRVPEDPILSLPGFDVPVEVVGRARTFPGIVGDRPMLVLDRHAMETATEASGLSLAQFVDGTEVWALANEQEAQTYVASRGGTVLSSTSVAWLRDTPRYLAVSSMLRFLLALGGLAAAVVLIGVALYLQSRQRRSETSYALARRMGLARASHLRSVAFEVSALLLVALAVGAGLAGFASFLVNEDVQVRSVDVDVVLFRLPIPLVAGIGAALVLFAWLAAGFAQWRADRVDVGEVMRVAE